MSDSLLNSLVKSHNQSQKNEKLQTALLQKICDNQEKLFAIESKRFKQEERDRRKNRRKSGDRNILGELKKKKEEDKKKKGGGLFENIIQGLMDGLKLVTPLLSKLALAIGPLLAKLAAVAGTAVATAKTIKSAGENLDLAQRGRGKTTKGKDGHQYTFISTDIGALKAAQAKFFKDHG